MDHRERAREIACEIINRNCDVCPDVEHAPPCNAATAAIAAALEAVERETRSDILLMGEPFSMPDVVEKLCGAVDHLLGAHNCDSHGWEELQTAACAARAWLRWIRAAAPPAPVPRETQACGACQGKGKRRKIVARTQIHVLCPLCRGTGRKP
jgi:hypothetical protein